MFFGYSTKSLDIILQGKYVMEISVYSNLGADFHGSYPSVYEATIACENVIKTLPHASVSFIIDENGYVLHNLYKSNNTVYFNNDSHMSKTMIAVEDPMGYPSIKVFNTGYKTVEICNDPNTLDQYIGATFIEGGVEYALIDIHIDGILPNPKHVPSTQSAMISDFFLSTLTISDEPIQIESYIQR